MTDQTDDGRKLPDTSDDRVAERMEPGRGPAGGSGVATPLQPGGTIPGGGPGASQGSLGTGGAQSGGDTGAVKKGGV